VKQFVRGLVLAPAPGPVVRFETEPVTRCRRLGNRGARCFDDERVETLIQANENALLAFGGVPPHRGALRQHAPLSSGLYSARQGYCGRGSLSA
jgi:hypothetical protein